MHKGASKTVYAAKTEDGFDSAPASASGGIASCVRIGFYHHKIEAAMKRTGRRALYVPHLCCCFETSHFWYLIRHEDTIAQLVPRMHGRSHQF